MGERTHWQQRRHGRSRFAGGGPRWSSPLSPSRSSSLFFRRGRESDIAGGWAGEAEGEHGNDACACYKWSRLWSLGTGLLEVELLERTLLQYIYKTRREYRLQNNGTTGIIAGFSSLRAMLMHKERRSAVREFVLASEVLNCRSWVPSSSKLRRQDFQHCNAANWWGLIAMW